MTQYRFINSRTEECALLDGFLTREVERRSSTNVWSEILDDICTTFGWEIEDTLAVSNDGLFAWLSLGSIEVKNDFIGSDLQSCADRFYSMLWK